MALVQIPARAELWQAVILKPLKLKIYILYFWKLLILIHIMVAGQSYNCILNAWKATPKLGGLVYKTGFVHFPMSTTVTLKILQVDKRKKHTVNTIVRRTYSEQIGTNTQGKPELNCACSTHNTERGQRPATICSFLLLLKDTIARILQGCS